MRLARYRLFLMTHGRIPLVPCATLDAADRTEVGTFVTSRNIYPGRHLSQVIPFLRIRYNKKMASLKTVQARYTATFVGFMALVVVLTVYGIGQFVSPRLTANDENMLTAKAADISDEIKTELARVQAQARVITELVPQLSSDDIDRLLPFMVNQYGEAKVFGGGIWPLPNVRTPGRAKHSTFYHRDASGKLIVNTHWNSPESLNYFEQGWHKGGLNSPAGQCAWAPAYQDAASPEPRTNCAMAITKDGQPWGVSTIDVTLGFFNKLVEAKEQEVHGRIMIIEADGKILSNVPGSSDKIVLRNVSELAAQSPFINGIKSALAVKGTGTSRLTYQNSDGEESTLFLMPVAGTPWLLAVSQNTDLLKSQSETVLKTLAWLQIPMVLVLLVLMIVALRTLMNRLGVLKTNIDTLSAGDADLTRRIAVKGHDEVDQVGESVNNFIAYLQRMMLDVSSSTSEIAGGIEQLRSQAGVTSAILIRHANETDQAVTAITEMSSTADEVARSAAQTASFTQSANENAQVSKTVVADASDSVNALISEVDSATSKVQSMEQDAKRINAVLAVIGEIAGQTNLLALNAAIEAARAGEQGRGFAVVADEVRALAARTQASTSEINEMLGSLQQGVSAAVAAMEKTRQSCQTTAGKTTAVTSGLDDMTRSVLQINDLSTQIATAAEEQSAVSEEISRNIIAVRHIVEELVEGGSSNERSTAALSESNTRLIALVRRFKVS
ncbi:Methyl-accepting chemotaxis protein [Pseudomonas amygdali pv. eriobotryae]|uniref:Methyl-accepting chemotaxis protein n=3 Tax=Pseudomonas amygdali TaxID=47877 RepID=A0A3M3AVE0_PSEA0|nr:Methyl-accepting chemotaxis protein [Pseudomonas amygdali pv. eriobotryae]